jgi:hypothetical protein
MIPRQRNRWCRIASVCIILRSRLRASRLKDAYFTLQDHGVEVVRVVDHVSQKSIYFHDPDGNRLEIYYELPHALDMFRAGREDRDEPFVFTR